MFGSIFLLILSKLVPLFCCSNWNLGLSNFGWANFGTAQMGLRLSPRYSEIAPDNVMVFFACCYWRFCGFIFSPLDLEIVVLLASISALIARNLVSTLAFFMTPSDARRIMSLCGLALLAMFTGAGGILHVGTMCAFAFNM